MFVAGVVFTLYTNSSNSGIKFSFENKIKNQKIQINSHVKLDKFLNKLQTDFRLQGIVSLHYVVTDANLGLSGTVMSYWKDERGNDIPYQGYKLDSADSGVLKITLFLNVDNQKKFWNKELRNYNLEMEFYRSMIKSAYRSFSDDEISKYIKTVVIPLLEEKKEPLFSLEDM